VVAVQLLPALGPLAVHVDAPIGPTMMTGQLVVV